jgi:hypothetical protein
MVRLCSSVRVAQAIGETEVEIWKDKMPLERGKYTEALGLMLRSRLHTVEDSRGGSCARLVQGVVRHHEVGRKDEDRVEVLNGMVSSIPFSFGCSPLPNHCEEHLPQDPFESALIPISFPQRSILTA